MKINRRKSIIKILVFSISITIVSIVIYLIRDYSRNTSQETIIENVKVEEPVEKGEFKVEEQPFSLTLSNSNNIEVNGQLNSFSTILYFPSLDSESQKIVENVPYSYGVISPLKDKITYVEYGSNAISIYDLESKKTKKIDLDATDYFGIPLWSPDQKYIAILLHSNEEKGLILDTNGKIVASIEGLEKSANFTWIDSSRLLYLKKAESNNYIYYSSIFIKDVLSGKETLLFQGADLLSYGHCIESYHTAKNLVEISGDLLTYNKCEYKPDGDIKKGLEFEESLFQYNLKTKESRPLEVKPESDYKKIADLLGPSYSLFQIVQNTSNENWFMTLSYKEDGENKIYYVHFVDITNLESSLKEVYSTNSEIINTISW